jgi:hypothetical protein
LERGGAAPKNLTTDEHGWHGYRYEKQEGECRELPLVISEFA